jgi:cell surface protein SprA
MSTAKPGEFFFDPNPSDTTKKAKTKSKTPDYTPEDRHGDPYSNPDSKSPFILPLPKNVETEVILDDSLKTYTIEENAGDIEYRPPSTMTFEEYSRYKNREMMKSYWRDKNSSDTSMSNTDTKSLVPKLKVSGLKGPFGSDYVEIRPTGVVSLDFGARWQRVYNPNIPIRQQRQGQFDFDQTISMNVVGKIGEKLKLTTNWDTKAAFEFQNNLKLEFTGFEEDIIQKIEAGNVSLPVNSALYSGAQNLFGVKTKLQFGRLTATTVFSTQRGKVEEMKVQGGAMSREFEIKADNYDEYRHFFLSHFFRDNYEASLKNLPVVTSGVIINRVQVWITNRVSNTKDLKNFVAYTDLGEPDTTDMYNKSHFKAGIPQAKSDSNIFAAHNTHNNLYDNIKSVRDASTISQTLTGAPYNLVRGSDYEVINQGRKLLPTEFKFHPTLGYITLNTPLRPDEVLAVSFEYTYNGKQYQVGELTEENQAIAEHEVIILKLIKPATIKTRLPTWDLMMKNIYQLGGTQITRENFQLRVIYKNDLTGADLPNLQEGQNTTAVPLLRLTGLDRLNPNNDIFPDGNFDYVEDLTIDSKNGRVIFPVLEPFGATIEKYFNPTTEYNLVKKYVFFELYDSTKSDAQQIASKNKYFLKGRYQAGSSSEIVLPGINIAPGSVTVLAGSNRLTEGVDYEIDYNLGRLRIKNQGVLQSNTELTIRFEKQDFINFRRKSFIGARFDYKINKDFYIGSTVLHQTEAPNISRVNIGDEPSKNTIVGLDANFKAESRFLTRAIDKLPIIQTKAVSSINFSGEGAMLIPGYPKILNKSGNEGGTSYLDDFEGAETPYDLTRIPTKWRLGATPMRFPEASSSGLDYAYHRAKLAWYSIDIGFFNGNMKEFEEFRKDSTGQNYLKNHFVRQIVPQEIFPNKDPQQIVVPESILDLAYYPSERGPYNFNDNPSSFAANPKRNWAAVTREIRNDIDFDNANIQYIEFWMLDPFMNTQYGKLPLTLNPSGWKPVTKGGYLFFNLGSISEDLMKDSKHAYENGLPVTDADQTNVVETTWGKVTTKQFITNAFDNSSGSRPKQDVGLDGLNNAEERAFLQKNNPIAYAIYQALADPAGDDFEYYIGSAQGGKGVLERYKNYNGLENNSPLNSGNEFTPANSTLPDNEDLNADNTLNEVEEYYEYKLSLNPGDLAVGKNHIVDKRSYKDPNTGETVNWYQVRIPIREPDSVVGNINGYKSIRFMRMYMTGFEEPVVVRMAQFQLVANQWRAYQPDDINPPDGSMSFEPSGSVLTISTVNIEENGSSKDGKSAYVLPPGFKRDQDAVSQTYRRLNEQSLQLCITDLEDGRAKAAYKNGNYNLINYDKIKMFLHAESQDIGINDGDMQAFLRVGTDFTENYYEINVPLKLSPPGAAVDHQVWPSENMIEIDISLLTDVKGQRNREGANKMFSYSRTLSDGKIITVVGNPDLTAVQTLMIGVRNPKSSDKRSYSVCIWANELRVTGFNSEAGYATTGRMNLKLADFATVNLSGKYTTVGWGALDQKVSQRERNNTGEWGVSSNISLDKFIPEKIGLRLPMYVSYDQRIVAPRFDPLDPDMRLRNSLANISDEEERDQYRSFVLDKTTRRSINFTNIQKVKTKKDAKSHLYDIENFSFTTAYSDVRRTNINLKEYNRKDYKGEMVYSYNIKGKNIEPFKKFNLKSPYFKPIKDFNFTPLPRTVTFRSSLDRRITKTQYFEGNPLEGFVQAPFFEKQFTFTRNYGINWDLTKSLTMDYKANVYAIIDEPNRDPSIEKENYRDSLWQNVLRGGRLKNFDQSLTVNYKLPIDKFPLTDWISADAKYIGGYMWTSGALGMRDTLGNLIQNNQTRGINGKLNLDKLYNKSKFLKNINNPPPPPKPGQKELPKDTSRTLPKRELKGLKVGIRTLMSMKSINFTYDVARTTGLAGYMQIPKYIGLTPGSNSFDMLPFAFGSQDAHIRDILAENGWMSADRRLNAPFTQTQTRTFTAQTQLEPIKDFRLQLNVNKKKSTNYQELYRIDSTGTRFVSESPGRNGSLTISVISIRTAFRGKIKSSGDPNSSVTFEEFEEYRDILKSRLPNSAQYDTNSQHVLIPAFLAAYTKRDPHKVSLNPYPTIPLPNWRIDYSGLTKIKAIREIFPSLTIQHAYQSTYNIGNYNSSLLYGSDTINPYTDLYNTPFPGSFNSAGMLAPIYIIESVNITEAFNPLFGVNFRTKKKLTGNIQFKKARTITLNLTNSQVTEVLSNDITVGFGIIKTGFQPIKKLPPLKNEMNAKLDITVSDRKTLQRKFNESATVTAGNLNIQIRPNVTYSVNQRVNVNVYFERLINAPKISSSYKSASTRFGVLIRFTLS